MNFSQIASKLRHKISNFSGELSKNLDKTCGRFIDECLYGILSSESVLLSEIGRSLTSQVSLKKIEERFCRQLAKENIHKCIHQTIVKLAAPKITEDTLLILDQSDITKKYAQKMEYMARVRDGSEKDFGNGYNTINIIAATLESNSITPLYHGLYSSNAPDFVSENEQINNAINHIGSHCKNKGIWVMDRGCDRRSIILPLLKSKRDFIIRLKITRGLCYENKNVAALDLAGQCELEYSDMLSRISNGQEEHYRIQYGFVKVSMAERTDVPLYLVVVKGYGINPVMLLTTRPMRKKRSVIYKIIMAYFKRWDVEETIRYLKQSYDFENIRVLTYSRLKNMAALLLAAIYFTTTILDATHKLKILTGHVLHCAKRIFGIPDFKYYAISDGLSAIFKRCPPGIIIRNKHKKSGQYPILFNTA